MARSPAASTERRRPRDGGPAALPGWLDATSERWWSLGPRTRAVAVGLVLALVVALAGARGLSAPYGPQVAVLIATEDLPVGTDLAATDRLRPARRPADLVPPGASTRPTGLLAGPLPRGAVLTSAHVTEDGLGTLAGPDRALVPLPREVLPAVATGDALQVVTGGPDGALVTLSERGEVVALDDDTVWLAVDGAQAAEVAAAGLRGNVAISLLPP